jgi:hypothetical protein
VAVAQVLDDATEPAQAAHQLVALGSQHLGGRCRRDAAPGLLEQHQPRLALQRRELLADRGRRVAEVVGRGLYRTAGHHGPEDPESLDVEHADHFTALLHET